MDVFEILLIIKIVISLWALIFLIVCSRTIRNVINLIPKTLFEKTRDAYSITVQLPRKVTNTLVRFVTRRK